MGHNPLKNLIRTSQTMTLATAVRNQAWAAPVFYVARGRCFYFFSSPDARHITQALASAQAAAAIYAEAASWQHLMGVQLSGKIRAVSDRLEAGKAFAAYMGKFSLIKNFFSDINRIGLTEFSDRFHSRLYCFTPESVLFMDNSLGFGFRTEIPPDTL